MVRVDVSWIEFQVPAASQQGCRDRAGKLVRKPPTGQPKKCCEQSSGGCGPGGKCSVPTPPPATKEFDPAICTNKERCPEGTKENNSQNILSDLDQLFQTWDDRVSTI